MSMNLQCRLVFGSVREVIHIQQTPTEVTYRLLYGDDLEQEPRWREIAKRYLAWLAKDCADAPAYVKKQRKIIGRAWRRAEEHGGFLEFFDA